MTWPRIDELVQGGIPLVGFFLTGHDDGFFLAAFVCDLCQLWAKEPSYDDDLRLRQKLKFFLDPIYMNLNVQYGKLLERR